jgi:integrase/recombinase XerC
MDYILSFLNYLEFEKRYSARTIESYQTDLVQFTQYCTSIGDGVALLTANSKLVRGWMVFLIEGGCENRSVNRKMSTLRSFYKYLSREGYISVNPLVKIESLKTKKQLPVFVTQAQTDKLFDEVDFGSDFAGQRSRFVLLLFYDTGIRLSELVNIRPTDFDRDNLTLKVLGKRSKERIIPVTRALVNTLDNYLLQREQEIGPNVCDFLFVTDKGTKVYPKFVYKLVTNSLGLVTSMSKRSPHVLRHTFATHMLNNGASISAIKELLGHTSLAATQVYTHNTFEKLKKIYNQAHPRA